MRREVHRLERNLDRAKEMQYTKEQLDLLTPSKLARVAMDKRYLVDDCAILLDIGFEVNGIPLRELFRLANKHYQNTFKFGVGGEDLLFEYGISSKKREGCYYGDFDDMSEKIQIKFQTRTLTEPEYPALEKLADACEPLVRERAA